MMSRRATAAAEALAAAAVVIGHNVFRVVPNEVVVLVIAGAISCAVRRQAPSAIGYRRPTSWWRTVAVALAVAAALQAFSIFVVDPLAVRFTGETADLSDFQPVVGNLKLALIYLLVIWSFAAFGEELPDRLLLPLINEAVACLHEGVVADADLLDAGVIFDAGFAPFTGGPIRYARARGIDNVVATLTQFARRFGTRFTPHEGWQQLRGAA